MNFDFFVHGLWVLGAIFFFVGGMIAGNIEWVTGTTEFSYWFSVLIGFAMFLVAGMCWISSAVNAREELRGNRK